MIEWPPKLDGKVTLLNILYSALCELFLEKWRSSQILENEQKIKF